MSSLRTIERQPFEDLFGMSSGYVLHPHFTNPTFQSLFTESVGVNIYSDRYSQYGDSKAKRLRAFWELESDSLVGKLLNDLLDFWAYKNPAPSESEKAAFQRCRETVARLQGKPIPRKAELTEEEFLSHDYSAIDVKSVPIEASLIPILESRFHEAVRCLKAGAPLSTVIMCGSILEGLLLGMALVNPKQFNQSSAAPKDKSSQVLKFPEWSLLQLIDVSCDLGLLTIDVKKFGHALRDFRNYIHPFQQMSSQFTPDKHTAEICLQVLRAAVACLSGKRI